MAIDFPASPTSGQIYQGYYYDSSKSAWRSQNPGRGSVITSATTPTGASAGDMWFNTVDGTLFIYYNDGMSTNWVEVNSTSSLLGAQLDTRITSLESTRTSMLAGTAKIPGSVVQVQEYRSASGDKTASSGAYVNIVSASFTTKFANSKLFITYYSGQMNPGSAQSNPMFDFQIDGTSISDFSTNHIFYSDAGSFTIRPTVTIPIMTAALTQGTHTILVRGGAYNSSYTFDFQSSGSPERRGRLIVMEIAQ